MDGIVVDPNFTASWLLVPLLVSSAIVALLALFVADAYPVAARRGFMVAGLLSLPALLCAVLLRYGTSPVVLRSPADPRGKYEVQAVILHHGDDHDKRGYVSLVDTANGRVLKSEYRGLADFSVMWDKAEVTIVCRDLSGNVNVVEWALP